MTKSFATVLRDRLPDARIHAGLDPEVSFGPWNPTHAEWPLARMLCATPAHVAEAVRIAADHDIPVSVAGGREDIYGRNSRAGHLVLDLRAMTGVVFDADHRIVTAGGGVTTRGLLAGLPAGIVTPTTTNANVGIIGAAAGGGYGALCGAFGLACDALAAAEVVLADGRIVRVDADENADLLWALRGGGTGFGVVTQASFTTHTLPSLIAAAVEVPLAVAGDTLLLVQELVDAEPDALGLLPLFMRKDEGAPTLTLFFTWAGAGERGRQLLGELASIAGANIAGGEAVAYRDTLDDGAIWPWGKGWALDTRTIPRITAELARRLADAASDMPLPGTILFLHDFHGYATRVPHDSAAFALRSSHYVAMVCAPWTLGDDEAADRQRGWRARVRESLAPLALAGGYPPFLAPRETERLSDYYGEAGGRLAKLKARLDPHELFRAT